MTRFVLVHAPLLGPATWRTCADVLGARGHPAVIPDIRACLQPAQQWWERAADRVVRDLADDETGAARGAEAMTGPVVVGHSGAGALLPLVAERVRARQVIFVDAVVPAATGPTRPPSQLREFAARLAQDGLLPPWSTWWPDPNVMAELVPDDAVRQAVEAEQTRLPADFVEVGVPVPDGWPSCPVSYLQFSAPYDEAAAAAAARGWTVRRLPGLHLDQLRRPDEVADALIALF